MTVRSPTWASFVIEKYVSQVFRPGFFVNILSLRKQFEHLHLSSGSEKLKHTPNAGGSSVKSEVLSFEILVRIFGVELHKTEMELKYWPKNGKMTDYSCQFGAYLIGVSVTRAFSFFGDFEMEDALRIMKRKLRGVIESSAHVLDKFRKQILHVFTRSEKSAKLLQKAYSQIDSHLKSNTIILVTVSDAKWIYVNPNVIEKLVSQR
eukprot:Lithocolla_globosa_v1_NODE_6077_length_1140_cov_4.457143.p1 type:complete len:206 gc:universal NODE_6077_length_1140_cov_4.457143:773-156(-)